MSFHTLGLPEPILKGVRAAGYDRPTPVQSRAIPMILPGDDLVAAAETGSGKTAAFLLPILTRLLTGPAALRALVLVPTRELAAQVEACARDYARFTPARVGAVYGGVPIGPQERMLRNDGVELLIATPGRLLDLHERQSVSLEDVEVLVLDEADRMVDMGFAPDLERILAKLPADRQTLMFSATMPPELNRVARRALSNPRRLDLGPPSRPVATIAQSFYPVPRHLKVDLLDRLLRRSDHGSAIVFTRTKRGADRLGRQLDRLGHDVAVLHGDRSQSQRERALQNFRRGRIGILIATDIASRGIDVDDVTHVVNFDVPNAPEDYVHRIGRTGRMGDSGDAWTFVSPEERDEVAAIERFMGTKVPRVTVEGFDYARRAPARSTRPEPAHHRTSSRPGRAHDQPRRESGRRKESARATAAVASPADSASHGRRRQLNAQDRRSRRRM
jgi:ATP-dependent RNA helicase RhlE